MLKYRESNLVKAGLIGTVLMILVVAVGLRCAIRRCSPRPAASPSATT
jgi:hypothetical protein